MLGSPQEADLCGTTIATTTRTVAACGMHTFGAAHHNALHRRTHAPGNSNEVGHAAWRVHTTARRRVSNQHPLRRSDPRPCATARIRAESVQTAPFSFHTQPRLGRPKLCQ